MKFENQMVKFVLKSVVIASLVPLVVVKVFAATVEITVTGSARGLNRWVAEYQARDEATTRARNRCSAMQGTVQSESFIDTDCANNHGSYACWTTVVLVCESGGR